MNFEEKQNIYAENLHEFDKRLSIARQQKKITIFELARLYCEQYSDTNDILTSLKSISSELEAGDEIIFLNELCHSRLSEKIKSTLYIGSSESILAGAYSKISYVKNRYNDIAFEHFSHSVANAKPDYASSFTECCENVFDGSCEFGILPIMNSKDGRLMSFYSLLDRYELKICETVDIESGDSSTILKHARISRACKEYKRRISKNQKFIFEFSIISESTAFFADLFDTAKQIGADLKYIDSLPVEYTSNMQKFFFSFSLPTQNALAFRLFVALNHQTYTPIGIYEDNE